MPLSRRMRECGKGTGWLLIFAIIVLSLVPASHRPTSGASNELEHIAIYLLAGVALGIGYQKRLSWVAIGLVIFAGLIEMAQLWVPGRHARFSDLLIDGVAAFIGAMAATLEKYVVKPVSLEKDS